MSLERSGYELFRGQSRLREAETESREIQIGFLFYDRVRRLRSQIPLRRSDGRFDRIDWREETHGELLPGCRNFSGYEDGFGIRKLSDFFRLGIRPRQRPFVSQLYVSSRRRNEIRLPSFLRGRIRVGFRFVVLPYYDRHRNLRHGDYRDGWRRQL